jgi:hypothetical protein
VELSGPASTKARQADQSEGILPGIWATVLRVRHDDQSSLVDVLNLQHHFDPVATSVQGWLDPHYRG